MTYNVELQIPRSFTVLIEFRVINDTTQDSIYSSLSRTHVSLCMRVVCVCVNTGTGRRTSVFYIGKTFQSIWYKDIPLSVFVTLNFWFSVVFIYFSLPSLVCVFH